ncbi:MAG TPA: hypothetical protein VII63_11805 [Caulobacteraceae bacterium]
MLVVISPAKALNFAPDPGEALSTRPRLAADITVLAKAGRELARPVAARFVIERRIKRAAQLRDLNLDCFSFRAETSAATHWVFVRRDS